MLCPGSFDPVTLSHVDLIERARALFGEVLACVAVNPAKPGRFAVDERLRLLSEAVAHIDGVEVTSHQGLLVDLCHRERITVVVRGVRDRRDADHELPMAAMNATVGGIETVLFPARRGDSAVSSSLAMGIAAEAPHHLSQLLPAPVVVALMALREGRFDGA